MAALRVLSPASGRYVEALPIDAVPPELLAEWAELAIQGECPPGPFLHPAYARSVGEVRPDVEVAILREGGNAVGFLPYQRSPFGVGVVVGGRLCDQSGAVQRPGVSWNSAELPRTVGLRLLRLSNVRTNVFDLGPHLGSPRPAPFIDLTGGFESYRRASVDSGSSFVKQIKCKAGRLERDHGALRFEWHTTEESALATLLSWKAHQRKATRTPNVLDLPWARALIERLHGLAEPGFAGVLSALYVGDTLAAAHFGLRTDRVLHYWIPAYNEAFSRYSPGLICLMQMARAAAERGVERLDLGPGDERYKGRVATGTHWVATSSLSIGAVGTCMGAIDGVRAWSRGSTLGRWMRASGRAATRGSYAAWSALGALRGRTGSVG